MSEAWERSLKRLRMADDHHILGKTDRERRKREQAIPEHLKEEIKKQATSAEVALWYLQEAYYKAGFTKHSNDIGMFRASRLWDAMESGVPDEWIFEEDEEG